MLLAMRPLRFPRATAVTSVAVLTVVMGLLLLSCGSLPAGPSYEPVYPEKPGYAWTYRSKAGDKVLRMRSGTCFMGFRADFDGKDFSLSWSQEDSEVKGKARCRINVHEGPVVVRNLDTGERSEIKVFRRSLLFGPGFDIRQPVDLVAQIPGFAAVPKVERRYALMLKVERKTKGALPDRVELQLPAIALGGRRVEVPRLRLTRYERSGEGWWYAPVSGARQTGPAGRSLGGGGQVFKPADRWFEEPSLLRISAVFRGNPFVWNPDFTKNKGISEVYGEIYVEVLGDEPVRLTADRVGWRFSGEAADDFLPVPKSEWTLRRYTTTDLAERIDHLQAFGLPGKRYDDSRRDFRIVVPDFHPRRLTVTLPPVDASGHPWPIQPIEFEYK
jgi:hypothetical protein